MVYRAGPGKLCECYWFPIEHQDKIMHSIKDITWVFILDKWNNMNCEKRLLRFTHNPNASQLIWSFQDSGNRNHWERGKREQERDGEKERERNLQLQEFQTRALSDMPWLPCELVLPGLFNSWLYYLKYDTKGPNPTMSPFWLPLPRESLCVKGTAILTPSLFFFLRLGFWKPDGLSALLRLLATMKPDNALRMRWCRETLKIQPLRPRLKGIPGNRVDELYTCKKSEKDDHTAYNKRNSIVTISISTLCGFSKQKSISEHATCRSKRQMCNNNLRSRSITVIYGNRQLKHPNWRAEDHHLIW